MHAMQAEIRGALRYISIDAMAEPDACATDSHEVKTEELLVGRGETRAKKTELEHFDAARTQLNAAHATPKWHARTRGWSLDDVPPIAAEQFEQ